MNQWIEKAIEAHARQVELLRRGCIETLADIAGALTRSLGDGGTVYLCGNGGSAADAQHVAGELLGRFRHERKPLPAVALTTDSSTMTAIANDYDYREVFARPLAALGRRGDLLWGFSTSGHSANVVAAAEVARRLEMTVVPFTGRGGSPLEQAADHCLAIEADETSLVQEMHQLAYHIVCDLVDVSFCDGSPRFA